MSFDHLAAEKSSEEGTGVRLSIPRSLVEMMGGEITCENKSRIGKSFCVFPQLAWIETITKRSLLKYLSLHLHTCFKPLAMGEMVVIFSAVPASIRCLRASSVSISSVRRHFFANSSSLTGRSNKHRGANWNPRFMNN